MAFVSVTRLRVRAMRFLPLFAYHTLGATRQCRHAPGLLDGALLVDRRFAFWTLTVWDSQDSMRRYMTTGDHGRVMPRLMAWCDEASVVHWTQDDATLPTWPDAGRRMKDQGRPSKVHHPSTNHAALGFADPRPTRSSPIRPARRLTAS